MLSDAIIFLHSGKGVAMGPATAPHPSSPILSGGTRISLSDLCWLSPVFSLAGCVLPGLLGNSCQGGIGSPEVYWEVKEEQRTGVGAEDSECDAERHV